MNKLIPFLFLFPFTCHLACTENYVEQKTKVEAQHATSDLQVDHFNLWVENPAQAKQKLVDLGFVGVPDSLSKVHHGQGTAGRFFYFLNGYLELIFVYNDSELNSNVNTHPDLDFTERAAFKTNGASPFGIGLKVKGYAVEKIPFAKYAYHQEWMNDSNSIYTAKNSKVNLGEPSVFVVYPEIEADDFKTLDDLKQIPEEAALWREFFKHPNGAKRVTKIAITSTNLNKESETTRALNEIENLTVKQGQQHLMELYFDNQAQDKTFDLRPDLPLKIYL